MSTEEDVQDFRAFRSCFTHSEIEVIFYVPNEHFIIVALTLASPYWRMSFDFSISPYGRHLFTNEVNSPFLASPASNITFDFFRIDAADVLTYLSRPLFPSNVKKNLRPSFNLMIFYNGRSPLTSRGEGTTFLLCPIRSFSNIDL